MSFSSCPPSPRTTSFLFPLFSFRAVPCPSHVWSYFLQNSYWRHSAALSSKFVLIRYYKCLKFGKDRVLKVLDCLQIHKMRVLNIWLSLTFSEGHDYNVDCFYFLKAPV